MVQNLHSFLRFSIKHKFTLLNFKLWHLVVGNGKSKNAKVFPTFQIPAKICTTKRFYREAFVIYDT